MRLLFNAFLFAFLALSTHPLQAVETRGLTVVAKDTATNQTGEVKLYNKSYAVIIGIDDYPKLSADHQLHYAVNDAKGVESALRKHFRFDRIVTLYNKDATKDRILELFTDELPAQMGEEDSLFVFWAGHGNQEKSRSGDIGYLIPHDGTPKKFTSNISMTQLKDDISRKIPAKHVFYVMDACYGGLLAETRGIDKQSRRDLSYLKEITKEQVRQVLTAGSKGQEVLDGGPRGHSVFTGRLIEALEAAGDFITANEIQAILKEKVYGDAKGRGHNQTPGYGTFSGSGDFVFIPNIEQKVADIKADIERLEREQAELEESEAMAIKANNSRKHQEAELAKKSGEAKLKAAKLREQQLERETKQRNEEQLALQRFATYKGEEEQKLVRLKSDVEKKRLQLQTNTKVDTMESAVAQIRRLNSNIAEIEASFEKELLLIRQQVTARYIAKMDALDKQQKDEFENSREFDERISKEKSQLRNQQTAEFAALTTQAVTAAETAPLKEAIRRLADKEFTLGPETIEMGLGQYDADRQSFPLTFKSKSALVKVAMNGIIPLSKDKAKVFKQQYQVGAIRPAFTFKTGTGEPILMTLVNDSDNSVITLNKSDFVDSAETMRNEKTLTDERNKLLYIDPSTGLQWVRNCKLAGKKMIWKEGKDWVENLNYAGYSDWRLPTKAELSSFAKHISKKPTGYFINSDNFNTENFNWYWSSTSYEVYYLNAWYVNMRDGRVDFYNKENYLYVWPVRSVKESR